MHPLSKQADALITETLLSSPILLEMDIPKTNVGTSWIHVIPANACIPLGAVVQTRASFARFDSFALTFIATLEQLWKSVRAGGGG